MNLRHLLATVLLLMVCDCIAVTPEGKELLISDTPVQIARDGEALVPIVIAPNAPDSFRTLAYELATYLQRITGASFSVEKGSKPAGITLGTLQQFPDSELDQPLAIHDVYDGVEAFVLRSDGARIRLIGNTELGVRHAVWRFLELLGCRWFFMGKNWEVVPRFETLSFDLNEASRPDIWSRLIWFDRLAQDPDTRDEFSRWQQRNRLGDSLKVRILHSWHRIPAHFKAEFASHPEYFALADGTRKGPQFCVTNKGLQAIVIRYAQNYFEQNPSADMVSLDPADQAGWCNDPEWEQLGYHHSAQPFYLANVVARELQQTHPGKFVGLLAYSWYSQPPEFDLEPNVFVQLTRGMNSSTLSFEQLFERWAKHNHHLGVYEYFSHWPGDKAMLPGSWLNDTAELTTRMRRYAAKDIRSISAQASNHWGLYGLSYYLAARLMWDASADVEAIMEDFYRNAFGPAAPAMERYYRRLHAPNRPLPGIALVRQSIDDLQAATSLAEHHPEVLARLAEIKEYLVYNYLGEQVKLAATPDEKLSRMLEWFTWAYRTRLSHMFSWLTFRSAVGRPAATEFDNPTWFWRNTLSNPELNPWRDETPVTAKELGNRLQTIKDAIGEIPEFEGSELSDDFVVVSTDRKGPAQRARSFSTEMNFLLASVKGEPLEFAVEQRKYTYERPPAVYRLTTQAGELVAAGELPVGEHQLALSVPGPGIYRFSCFSRLSGFRIVFPEQLPNALVFERAQRYRPHGYMARSYFYVPRGEENVVFHCYECGTVVIRNADDDIVHNAPTDGSYVVIPVKPGQDGRVWSLGGDNSMRLRYFSFLNLPTVLSTNPDRIFTPREIASKDGLQIVVLSDEVRDGIP